MRDKTEKMDAAVGAGRRGGSIRPGRPGRLEPPRDGGPLQLTEHLLAVIHEDVPDRLARRGRHQVVGVGERHAEFGGEQRAHR